MDQVSGTAFRSFEKHMLMRSFSPSNVEQKLDDGPWFDSRISGFFLPFPSSSEVILTNIRRSLKINIHSVENYTRRSSTSLFVLLSDAPTVELTLFCSLLPFCRSLVLLGELVLRRDSPEGGEGETLVVV